MKAIMVTGASKGIGRETARLFAHKGFRVLALARSEKPLQQLARENHKGEIIPVVCDLSSPAKAKKSLRQVLGYGPIDGAILNAGLSLGGELVTTDPRQWQAEIAMNYLSPATLLKELIKIFEKQGHGHIMSVGSLTALLPFPSNGSYAASKAAFYSLMRTVKIECSSKPIRFSMVLPGMTDTEMSKGFGGVLPKTSPQTIAQALWRCWRCPQFPFVVGILNQLAYGLDRLNPQLFNQLMVFGKFALPKAPHH